jgi:1-pyrroline-5-carboxylate dehydrogenase
MTSKFRITYATLSADNEELQSAYDAAVEEARGHLGANVPIVIDGKEEDGADVFEERSPIDHDIVVARVQQASTEQVDRAVAAAKDAFLEWDSMGWQQRIEILRGAADLIEDRLFVLAALMAFEVGKTRLEALGDVQETAELIRWNCDEIEKHDGFRTPMSGLGAAGDYYDVMRPYGVWAVISPFNFPLALSGGPSSGALAAGNTVVLKPSPIGSLLGHRLFEVYRDAGMPTGAFQFVPGADEAGAHLVRNDDVQGITFTGSYKVGMDIYKQFAKVHPKPVVAEMGGKNPTIVTKNADLDKATDGVLRSAFGYGGQKCSAGSRVYVEREVYDDFLEQLKTKTEKITPKNPLDRDAYLSPVIDEDAVGRFEKAVAEAESNGRVVAGGHRITDGDLARGNFVEPTVVEVPEDSYVWTQELFVPYVAVAPFEELDEAIEKSNASELGLTAGFFSEDQAEIDEWLQKIQAGVVYVNRRAGSTTGAWPGVQPFGGWKGSGSTGKAGGGPYYVLSYLREQSRTVIAE